MVGSIRFDYISVAGIFCYIDRREALEFAE